jgi:hypothetical protein
VALPGQALPENTNFREVAHRFCDVEGSVVLEPWNVWLIPAGLGGRAARAGRIGGESVASGGGSEPES